MGASASSLFSGGGFMPSQSTQTAVAVFSKSLAIQSVLPLTVKQIIEAYHSNDDKSNFVVDGVDASRVRLLGIAMNKAERVTDVSFSLDDGTGKIDANRWVNETSDTNEMAIIQNGMYVAINRSLKGFQGKRHVPGHLSTGGSDCVVYKIILDLFQEPASLAPEHGLHVDESTQRWRLLEEKIKDAI